MATQETVDLLTRLVWGLSLAGGAGREVSPRLDLVRSLGILPAWRRTRGEAALRAELAEKRSAAYRAIWQAAADDLGAALADLPGGFLEIRHGRARTRVWHHWVMLDDPVTLRLSLDKPLVHRLVAQAGVHVPEHLEFLPRELSFAHEFLQRSDVPCVVKPASQSGGGGVTGGVERRSQLMRATVRAARLEERLLIERHVPGEIYRLLLLDGGLLDVVRRRRPLVTGDGQATVAELISLENRRRLASPLAGLLPLLREDLDCLFALEQLGLSLGSVLDGGVTVAVKTAVSQNSPRENETVREAPHDEVVRQAAAAAEAVGLRLAGVDVATPDLGRPLGDVGGAVLEVNGTPGLHYHYAVADPSRATPVASSVLRAVLA